MKIVDRIINWVHWVLCFSPMIFLAALLSMFIYGRNKDPHATVANEISGLETWWEIIYYTGMLCFWIIPLWLVLGVADLLAKRHYYLRGVHVAVFILSMLLFGVVLEIAGAITSVSMLDWYLD